MGKMKPDVNDIDAITINHYNHAGLVGCKHFRLLLNALIDDINVTSISEVNTVFSRVITKIELLIGRTGLYHPAQW